ncbi:MAG TPA: UbiA-like polyprenyltransferase [Fimbriimonadaceae bacterium]|nr:UbiA-like polyprenyltransferase [Fimbriimonadaceae bacterium]HRJ32226.1 UbiA-like polyprenyltransferase [Fimbriimonadaceae bacterium]
MRGWAAFRAFLEMIKIEHSIFALPFAMLGMIWAADGFPGWRTFGLILLAMVSARSAAMAYNRIADRDIDAKNPRTQIRALPAGLLTLRTASLYFWASLGLFILSAALLNPLALMLAPAALLVILGYSLTKRFTSLCHYILGLGLGIAPAASSIAVLGVVDLRMLWFVAGVMLWTAGFDIIYSLQDEEFDRQERLRSIPQSLGKARALAVSRLSHLGAVGCLLMGGAALGLGMFYFIGVGLAAAVLVYEQSLVKPNDLSRVNLAFFTLNGLVSIGVFAFGWFDFWWSSQVAV